MSLKDKLRSRAKTLRSSDVSLQDLPLDFRKDLVEFTRKERLRNIFGGIHKDQFIQVSLAPGNNTAFISAFFRNQGYLTLDDIDVVLSNVGVVHGVNLGPLEQYLENGALRRNFKCISIAKGTPVTPGQAGHMDLRKRPYNSSDNLDLESFDQVAVEDEVAVLHPPIRGIPGMTVMGEEIHPPAIAMDDYRFNANIKALTDEEDRQVLIATVPGFLVQHNLEVNLHTELRIDKDITFHRGDLVYGSNVKVNGDICEKVSMNIGGDLVITGMISEAEIRVDDNLYIDKGVFGKQESSIYVGGRLVSRYLNEVNVDCEGDMSIEKEILNSHVWTRGRIDSPRVTVVGGTVFSHDGAEVQSIGSELGLKSLFVIGLDKREYRINHELLPEIEEFKEKVERAEEVLPNAPPDNKEKLEDQIAQWKGEISSREAEIEYFREKMKPQNPDAALIVQGTLFPGTTIMIAEKEYTAMERVSGPLKVFLDDGVFKFEKIARN